MNVRTEIAWIYCTYIRRYTFHIYNRCRLKVGKRAPKSIRTSQSRPQSPRIALVARGGEWGRVPGDEHHSTIVHILLLHRGVLPARCASYSQRHPQSALSSRALPPVYCSQGCACQRRGTRGRGTEARSNGMPLRPVDVLAATCPSLWLLPEIGATCRSWAWCRTGA